MLTLVHSITDLQPGKTGLQDEGQVAKTAEVDYLANFLISDSIK